MIKCLEFHILKSSLEENKIEREIEVYISCIRESKWDTAK